MTRFMNVLGTSASRSGARAGQSEDALIYVAAIPVGAAVGAATGAMWAAIHQSR